MAEDWTREEVEATVADYLAMLTAERLGQLYSKTEHRRNLRRLLNNRSDGSVERKHQNISAILIELGMPYIDGYKPLSNFQQLLFQVVQDRLRSAGQLVRLVAQEVTLPAELPTVEDILATLVAPPQPQRPATPYPLVGSPERRVAEARPAVATTLRRADVNYLAIEAANKSLGLAGEEFVMRFEAARLIAAGHERLAARIEHISLTRGDGEGFDVLSYETTGQERLIEVKTTSYGALTPFFITRNELSVSQHRSEDYHLYRLFAFRKAPKLFQKRGSIDEGFALTPEQYLARVI